MKSSQFPQLSSGNIEQPATKSDTCPDSASSWATIGRSSIAALSCVIAFGFLIRLYLLTNQSFWFDEGATLSVTSSGSLHQTYLALMSASGADKYQPLYFFLLATWRAVIGDGEFALRFFSVVPGAITPLVMYFASKRLFGHQHALLTTLFVVCSAFCIAYSQELRPYSLLLLLASVQLLALTPALAQPDEVPANRLMLTLATTLACLGSILLVMFTIMLATAQLLAFRQWRIWIKTWSVVCLGIPLIVLYYISIPTINDVTVDAINGTGMPIWKNLMFSQYGHLAGQTFGPSIESLRLLESFKSVLMHYPIELFMLSLTIGILLISTILNLRSKQRAQGFNEKVQFIIYLYGLSLFGAFVVAVVTQINWMPRHSVYLMIPLSIGLPLALHTTSSMLSGKYRRVQFIMASGAFTALITINVFASSNYFHDPEHWRDDYRSASIYLQEHIETEDQTFMLWGEPYLVSYYGHNNITNLWRLEDENLIISHILDAKSKHEGRVFIFINREYSWALHSPELIDLLETSFELIPTVRFNNVNIYQLNNKQLTSASEKIPATN